MVKSAVLKIFAKKLKKGIEEVNGRDYVCPVCQKSFSGPTSFGDIHLHMIKNHDKVIQLGDEQASDEHKAQIKLSVPSMPKENQDKDKFSTVQKLGSEDDIESDFAPVIAGNENEKVILLCDELTSDEHKAQSSLSTSSSYVDEKLLIAIRKAFPDFSAFRRIVLTGDLILVPRIRLKFVFGCPGGSYDLVPDGTILKGIVATGFRRSQFFPKKLPLSDDDIDVHYLVPPKLTADNFEIIAEGYFYFRDSKLNSEDLYLEFQKKLIKKLGKYSVKYFGTLFETRVSTEGDLTEMISGLSQEKPPTIVLKGVPCEWFADHHSMESLKALFHTFGRLRILDIEDNSVSIQFEDPEECSKALKKLSSCSLKKSNDSRIVDYDLRLKDLPDSNISQEMFTNNNNASWEMPVSKETFKGQDMHALMVRVTEIEEELKYLKAKMEASSAC